MATSFLIPIVTWLPRGYDCTIVMPPAALADRLIAGSVRLERYWQAVVDGTIADGGSDFLDFEDRRLVSPVPADVTWRATAQPDWPDGGGYLEFGIRAADGQPVFTERRLPSHYNVYTAPDAKSFFTCHTWKFGSPQVISQIAKFGRYVDAYSVIHIDRARDLDDSLVLINPYMKPILSQLLTQDGRRPPRLRIPAQSAVRVDLAEVIAPDEEEWLGQVQLTANNRLVTYIVKHSLRDPNTISTVEHLDPFRADPTHMPWFAWLRNRVGDLLSERWHG
jgi:hypothetical protein